MSLRSVLAVLSGVVVCLGATTVPGASEYTITDLGPLAGGSYSLGYGLNNGGQAVGGAEAAFGQFPAVVWNEGFPFSLGTLTDGYSALAFDVNDAGLICGESMTAGGLRAFRWHNGVLTSLETPLNGWSSASALNEAGAIAGWISSEGGSGHMASLWLLDAAYGLEAGVHQLGALPGGSMSEAFAINDAGMVVGRSLDGGSTAHAFLWLPAPADGLDAGLHALANTFGGTHSAAYGVNAIGQVVGSADCDGAEHACLWLSEAAYGLSAGQHDLGVLDGTMGSIALDINGHGQVVGWAQDAASSRAFLWDETHGLRDLNDLIDSATGWDELVDAWAINEHGQIVGNGLLESGEMHGFLLTPHEGIHAPEPTTWLMAMGGLLAIFFRFRRRVVDQWITGMWNNSA